MADAPSVAWFHCFSGIAGDMAMGALVDAGADLEEIRSLCERLPVGGWRLEADAVTRGGVGATKVEVAIEETSVVRTAAHIVGLVEEARLPDRIRRRALATFEALAEAEGRVHRHPPEQVHFHEIGGIDAIIDVVGTCAGLEVLEVDEVCASPLTTGLGTHHSAHGTLPHPAPAVVELLRGVPAQGTEQPFELVTPTGVALLAAMATEWGPLPAMVIEASGFGAGSRELDDRPNVAQVVLGHRRAELDRGQPVVLLESNVDDVTGETLAHAVSALLDAGAHDAWVTPIVMKKGRPGHLVSALVDPSLAGQVATVMRTETGTLGIRGHSVDRWPVARSQDQVEVVGVPVRVKVSAGRVKVEHDDAARVARSHGLPLREVVSLAEEAWRRGRGFGPEGEEPPDGDGPTDEGPPAGEAG